LKAGERIVAEGTQRVRPDQVVTTRAYQPDSGAPSNGAH
jgi:hypothetical protein